MPVHIIDGKAVGQRVTDQVLESRKDHITRSAALRLAILTFQLGALGRSFLHCLSGYPDALRRFVTEGFSSFDVADLEKLIGVGESILSGKGIPQALTMDDALKMKIACDVYLLKAFRRIEQQHFNDPSDGDKS